jgi:large subunit ribosomal protein L10
MLKEKKAEVIADLEKNLAENPFVVSTSYQGTTAQDLAQLRWALAAAGIEYHVVKTTLLRIAAEQTHRTRVMQIMEGPMALGFASDAVEAAKVLRQQTRAKDVTVQIRGGLLGERVLSAAEVLSLADLPPREVLVAQLAAQLQAPVSRLHRALSWPLPGLRNVLQARIESLAQ